MREVALREAAHPAVKYLPGRAEAIPLPDASCDAALLYFVWHHVGDKPAAALELLRMTEPRVADICERPDERELADRRQPF